MSKRPPRLTLDGKWLDFLDTANSPQEEPTSKAQMWVTLYTDASFWHASSYNQDAKLQHVSRPLLAENVTRWGAWAKSNLGEIKDAGNGPLGLRCSNTAEIHAIFEGIKMVLNEWGSGFEGICLNTDSETAIRVVQYGADPHRFKEWRSYQRGLQTLLGSTKLRCKHVKGHQGLSGLQGQERTRATLNHVVDKLARGPRKRSSP